MKYFLYFIVIFIIIFIIQFCFVNLKKIKKKKYNKIGEINYLVIKFKLDPKKIKYKNLSTITCSLNALIISFTSVIIIFIDIAFIWKMLIGFVLLFMLIYATYEILGRMLVKKGWKR